MRVLIGEDELLQRQGLALQLATAGFEVCGAVADAVSLVRDAREQQPDVVITDIRMPPGQRDDGLQAALQIGEELIDVGVVVLSHHLQRSYAIELLGDRPAGVGYLLKQRVTHVDRFCADVCRVATGGTVLDPEVVMIMVDRARRKTGAVDRLTTRQTEVLALMAQGRTNAAIARALAITEKAVVRHVSNLYDLLDLPPSPDDHRRVLAVVRFLTR